MTRAPGGREAEASLLTRVGPLWPDPASLSVSHRPARRAGSGYLVLPRLANPIWLVPEQRAGDTIRASAPGARGRALAAAYRSGVLGLLPVARLQVEEGADAPVLGALREMVPETADVAVRLGRPRPGRAVVVSCLDAGGHQVAVGKLGLGAAREAIAAEHRHLRLLEGLPLARLEPPRALGFAERGDHALLAMTVLTGDPASLDPDDPHLDAAMQELAGSQGSRPSALGSAGQVTRLRDRVADLGDVPSASWLEEELERLLDRHRDTELELGLWHGDWVSWNQRRSGDRIALWDWEHLEQDVPLGMDYVHYTAQHLRRLEGTSPEQEQRWLATARAGLRERWGRSHEQVEATLLLYLLVVNARYAEDRRHAPDAPARRGWTRALVSELNHA